jgi:hypothetical protein
MNDCDLLSNWPSTTPTARSPSTPDPEIGFLGLKALRKLTHFCERDQV